LGLNFQQRKELNYEPTIISKYRLSFRNELVHNFEQTRSVKQIDDGRLLRSSSHFDILEDTEAFDIHTTKRARLSRYIFEDFIKCRSGEPFMLYIAKALNPLHKGVFKKTSDQQITLGVGGGEKKISSKLFYSLRSTLSYCPLHDEVNSSFLTEKQFEKHYDQNEGFRIDFDGTVDPITNKCYSITFAWKQLIEDADDILFFGRPFNGTRPYHRLFRNKVDLPLLHHVFFQLSRETRGDTIQSSQLYAAYMERITAVLEYQVTKMKADIPEVTTSHSNAFFKRFNKLCETGFTRCAKSFNDYSQPIVLQQDIYAFLSLCPVVFPFQWKYFLKLRGADVNHKDYTFDKHCPKHRQVMFQILMIKRMANPQALPYWALIHTVALYGWGVGKAATDSTSHFGISVSSCTRDRKTASFTKDNVARMHCLLRKEIAPLFCYDNFQKGVKLLHMRGGHS
jgi:hypothetical protein